MIVPLLVVAAIIALLQSGVKAAIGLILLAVLVDATK